MAYAKILPIKSRLDDRVDYVLNEDKTTLVNKVEYVFDEHKTTDSNHVVYRSAINCEVETAFDDMQATKKRFKKTGGRLGYHLIHSFKPNEIDPKTAHEIGMKLAQELFGARYEVVVGTHVDKEHIHNHIIFNSVSFIDGKKYRNKLGEYLYDIRGTNDRLCKEYGLSIIMAGNKDRTLTYAEWLAGKNGNFTWRQLIKNDIDDCIIQAYGYGNFISLMQQKGYEVKQGKHVAFRPYGKERFSRGYKLGKGYSEAEIRARIDGKDLDVELPRIEKYIKTKNEFVPYKKVTGLKALYVHYLYVLGKVGNNQAPSYLSKELRSDLLKIDEIISTADFLNKYNIDTFDELIEFKQTCAEKVSSLNVQKPYRLKKELNRALLDVTIYQSAYDMYTSGGFVGMEDEARRYRTARNYLKDAGYAELHQIDQLRQQVNQDVDTIASLDSQIYKQKGLIKECDKAIKRHDQLAEKLNNVQEQQYREKEKNKDVSRSI